MTSPREWIQGARPRTLPVAMASVLGGTAIAAFAGSASWPKALLALITVAGVQAGANYANDYFDGIKGTDTNRIGPARLVASKAAAPAHVRTAALISLGIAAVAGVVIAVTTDLRLLLLGALCLLAAWTYTGGPRPYAYHGLGEVMVFLFFGPVAVTGITYIQVESLSGIWIPTLAAGTGVGILTAAVMLTNNLRDIDSDPLSGKLTVPALLGDRKSRLLYAAVLAAAVLCLAVVAATTSPWALLGLVFLAAAVPAVSTVLRGATGGRLVPVLAQTSVAELLWALGMFAGLAVAA
ncbi:MULTISPECIES: 1,4-dihydroxy-2-naphthoate polyprenyltransferase [unclassified Microbispora]|uniref:1,4-dihydroxy-2-naphthoate polyprenyltransferase n=1 Tax=unclassified Microbispora TaxID=2614687 RepID=UPI001475FCB0|nr:MULTISPECIES: 1,4-dihydroxy-2-naphthoate polyprenyltransferase [unclassified Microbispora]